MAGLTSDPLKEDDIMGPKSQKALQEALMQQGTGTVEEAVGLGQFENLTEKIRDRGGRPEEMSAGMQRIFMSLLGQGSGMGAAVQVLQDTLNDQGEDLKDDGVLGPKTAASFASVARKANPRALAQSFGSNLGFLQK